MLNLIRSLHSMHGILLKSSSYRVVGVGVSVIRRHQSKNIDIPQKGFGESPPSSANNKDKGGKQHVKEISPRAASRNANNPNHATYNSSALRLAINRITGRAGTQQAMAKLLEDIEESLILLQRQLEGDVGKREDEAYLASITGNWFDPPHKDKELEEAKLKDATRYSLEELKALTLSDMNKLINANSSMLYSAYRCHSLMHNLGFKDDVYTMSILIKAHLNEGDFPGASLLFTQLVDKYGTRRVIQDQDLPVTRWSARKRADIGSAPNNSESILMTVNGFIHAYARNGDVQRANVWFNKLTENLHVEPDAYTISGMINTYTRQMKQMGFSTSRDVKRDSADAERWFAIASDKYNITPDSVLCLTMLKAYATAGQGDRAVKFLEKMKLDGIPPTIRHFNIALSAYMNSNTYAYTNQKSRDSTQTQREMGFRKAVKLFDSIPEHNLKPNKVTFNTMISICVVSQVEGVTTLVDKYFARMLASGHQPDSYTLGSVGNFHANNGDFDGAMILFNDIADKKYRNVSLRTVHLNTLIKSININKTMDFVKKQELTIDLWACFIKSGILKPDSHTFVQLIRAAQLCNDAQDTAEACEFWFSSMLQLENKIEPEPFVVDLFKRAIGNERFESFMMRTRDISDTDLDKDIGM